MLGALLHASTSPHACLHASPSLLHAADRELLKLLQEEFVSLPVALLAEVMVGLTVATAGQKELGVCMAG